MNKFIEENLKDGAYVLCQDQSFKTIQPGIELEFSALRLKLEKYFRADNEMNLKSLCLPLSPEPYIIARIMGTLKAHKPGFPIMPIISAPDCIGKNLSKWTLKKLELVAKFFEGIKIHSAKDLFMLVADKQIPQDHRLVTWDYSSMFTNIPFNVAKSIIKKFYDLIQSETSVPVDLFMEILSFLVDGIGYFTYKNKIYKQNRGV